MIWWLKNLYWNIKRIIKWFPIIWKDREFDSIYFLQILAYKLKLMEEFYRSEYAISADRKDCATKIHVCRLLCDRLIKNEYHDMLGREVKVYLEDKNFFHLEVLDEGCKLGICKNWMNYEDYMKQQDLRYLCEILQKQLFSWWD